MDCVSGRLHHNIVPHWSTASAGRHHLVEQESLFSDLTFPPTLPSVSSKSIWQNEKEKKNAAFNIHMNLVIVRISYVLTIAVCVYVLGCPPTPTPHPPLPRSDLLFWDFRMIPVDIRVLSESGCTCMCPVCMSGNCFCTTLQISTVE